MTDDLQSLRDHISAQRHKAIGTLNQILHDEFTDLKIKFEQATWNSKSNKKGKPKKRALTITDIEALRPFHWGYEFDEVMNVRGGFDGIITNPPWEVLKPQAKEFFAEYSDLVTKNNMTIKVFKKKQKELLRQADIRSAWLDYLSRFPHQSNYFRKSDDHYKHQRAIVNGRKTGSDINLYKLFLERSYHLLRQDAPCGIVIRSGIYTDLGATGLRQMLFDLTTLHTLFGLSNERFIFEGVDHRFKFALLIFTKGGETKGFQAAFRIDTREAIKPEKLDAFLSNDSEHIELSVPLIKRLSPETWSVMEFNQDIDIQIAKKMTGFPLLGEEIEGVWNLSLTAEFHMTNDSNLFRSEDGPNRLPLYEGKMIHQFDHQFANPRYWVEESEGRARALKRAKEQGQRLDYQRYRLGMRSVASSTNERSLIATVLPQNIFCGNSVLSSSAGLVNRAELIGCVALLNSLTIDWMLRHKITTNINMFYIYQLPVPRLAAKDWAFAPIVERAAKLICTTREFDELAHEVGLAGHKEGVTNKVQRMKLRAGLDGYVAHLYNLTEREFAHILKTFPLVADPHKVAAHNAYRDIERGVLS